MARTPRLVKPKVLVYLDRNGRASVEIKGRFLYSAMDVEATEPVDFTTQEPIKIRGLGPSKVRLEFEIGSLTYTKTAQRNSRRALGSNLPAIAPPRFKSTDLCDCGHTLAQHPFQLGHLSPPCEECQCEQFAVLYMDGKRVKPSSRAKRGVTQ
jgi:hypothetical protein